MPESNKKVAVSLFCSSGIGDLGLQANGVDTVAACEILPERMRLFLHNHPEAKGFCGDIWEVKDDLIKYYKENYVQQLGSSIERRSLHQAVSKKEMDWIQS